MIISTGVIVDKEAHEKAMEIYHEITQTEEYKEYKESLLKEKTK